MEFQVVPYFSKASFPLSIPYLLLLSLKHAVDRESVQTVFARRDTNFQIARRINAGATMPLNMREQVQFHLYNVKKI